MNASTQEKTSNNLDEENHSHHALAGQQLHSLQLLRRTNNLDQKRALISRDQLKSDQPCLLVTDCTIVIEEDQQKEQSDRNDVSANKNRQEAINFKHEILNEEEGAVTTTQEGGTEANP